MDRRSQFRLVVHVLACQLPAPGTEVELRALCAEMMAAPLHRGRPMWDLTFVEGLAGHRVGLIERLHHSMADGLAAAELATGACRNLSPSLPQRREGSVVSRMSRSRSGGPRQPISCAWAGSGCGWRRGVVNADPSHHSVPSYGPVGSSDQHARHAENLSARCLSPFSLSLSLSLSLSRRFGVEGGGSRCGCRWVTCAS